MKEKEEKEKETKELRIRKKFYNELKDEEPEPQDCGFEIELLDEGGSLRDSLCDIISAYKLEKVFLRENHMVTAFSIPLIGKYKEDLYNQNPNLEHWDISWSSVRNGGPSIAYFNDFAKKLQDEGYDIGPNPGEYIVTRRWGKRTIKLANQLNDLSMESLRIFNEDYWPYWKMRHNKRRFDAIVIPREEKELDKIFRRGISGKLPGNLGKFEQGAVYALERAFWADRGVKVRTKGTHERDLKKGELKTDTFADIIVGDENVGIFYGIQVSSTKLTSKRISKESLLFPTIWTYKKIDAEVFNEYQDMDTAHFVCLDDYVNFLLLKMTKKQKKKAIVIYKEFLKKEYGVAWLSEELFGTNHAILEN
ncbi:MAG: hypothetical protein ACFFCS_10345 [Candidatus Hodarchaeota archaeon]